MKKIIAASLISLVLSSTAYATAPINKSPLNGFYLGGGVGYQQSDVTLSNNIDGNHDTVSLDNGLADLNLGYGKVLSQHFYLGTGLRYDYYGDVNQSKTYSSLLSTQKSYVQLNNALFLTVDPGLLLTPKTLIYANLGIGIVSTTGAVTTQTRYATSVPGAYTSYSTTQNESETKEVFSGIAGVGIRQAFSKHISMSAEIDHVAPSASDLPPGVSDLDYNEGLINFIYTFN